MKYLSNRTNVNSYVINKNICNRLYKCSLSAPCRHAAVSVQVFNNKFHSIKTIWLNIGCRTSHAHSTRLQTWGSTVTYNKTYLGCRHTLWPVVSSNLNKNVSNELANNNKRMKITLQQSLRDEPGYLLRQLQHKPTITIHSQDSR